MPNQKSSTFLQKLQLLLSHLSVLLPSGTSILLGGQSLTPQQIQSQLQAGIDLFTGVDSAKSLLKDALTKRKAAEAQLHLFYAMLVGYLRSVLGPTNSLLADAGIEAPKPKSKPSTVTQMAAELKRKKARDSKKVPAPEVKVVMFGPDGQPLPGSAEVPAPTPVGGGAPAGK
jgi:hypothetical protein